MTSMDAIGPSCNDYIQPPDYELFNYQVQVHFLINNRNNPNYYKHLEMLRSEITAKLENENLPPDIAAGFQGLKDKLDVEIKKGMVDLAPIPPIASLPRPFGL